MKYKRAAIVIIALLGGCTTAEPIMTPTGQSGHMINCPDGNGWSGCFEKAAEICGSNGYTVHDKSSEITTSPQTDENKNIVYNEFVKRSLMISCGRADW